MLVLIHWLHRRGHPIHVEVTRQCERLVAQEAAMVGLWETREVSVVDYIRD